MPIKIVLIGAGSAQFGYGTLGDIFQSDVLPGSHIVLHDINPDTLSAVESTGQQFIKEHELPFTISSTISRTDALQDADYCIISIEVGDRFKLWEQDWRIPQQFGIRQVYGENGGPGGLFHAMRIVPPILEICDDIEKICPEALVFNYSNPMSRICTTVHRKFPDLKFIGLCHEIPSLKQHLPTILNTPFENIAFKAGGLNHFSILLEATFKDTGKDAYPDIREKAPAYFEKLPELAEIVRQIKEAKNGPTPGSEPVLRPDAHPWAERRLFKIILEKFGYLPITTDSHFGEYIQWAHDVVDHKGILDFYHFYQNYLEDQTPNIELKVSERVIPIIEGIITDARFEESAVNLPNKGLIDGLPSYLVVEVPAVVDKNGISGVPLGAFPKGFNGLLLNQAAVHDLTAEAILQKSRELALQALLVDPVVDRVDAVEEMLDMFLKIQNKYLYYLK